MQSPPTSSSDARRRATAPRNSLARWPVYSPRVTKLTGVQYARGMFCSCVQFRTPVNFLRSPLTPEQLCQRRGVTFAGLRMVDSPHYSRDLEHGPGAGSGLLPRLPPPFLASVSRPLLSRCFSLCDLRLFVNKWMLLSPHVYVTTMPRCLFCGSD
jgi:hypothetical protein